MSKGTEHFKRTIEDKLLEIAERDEQFADSLQKEDKDIDECIDYIISQVKKIGAQGYTDDEIFNLAIHYYDEDDLEDFDPVEADVVVNHKPELSEEEKQELREEVRNEEMRKERNRLHKKKRSPKKKKQESEQSSLF